MTQTAQATRCPVLIVGVGNILMHDEGVGPCVISRLAGVNLPASVELLDGGIAGADLIDSICDRRKVVFVDVVDAGLEPGSVIRMTGDEVTSDIRRSFSLHGFGLVETLIMAKQRGSPPQEVIVFGVAPEDISCGLGLSYRIEAAVANVIELIFNELDE